MSISSCGGLSVAPERPKGITVCVSDGINLNCHSKIKGWHKEVLFEDTQGYTCFEPDSLAELISLLSPGLPGLR